MSRLVAVFLFTLLSLTFSSTLLHGEVAVRDGQRVASSSQSPNFVRELTDDNFEHDTQASTGSTTGDWFVVFQAPWCGHCKSMKQSWSDLATWVRDEQFPVSIASLDATQHVRTAKRLDIRGFPTIKFISKGEIYDYSGPRTLQSFQQYLENREWLLPGVTKRPVPPEVSTMEWLKDYLRETMNDVSTLMWRKTGGAAILVSLGVLVGILLSMLIFIVFIEPKPIIHPVTIGTPTLPIRNNSQQTSTSSTSSSIPQTNAANKKAE